MLNHKVLPIEAEIYCGMIQLHPGMDFQRRILLRYGGKGSGKGAKGKGSKGKAGQPWLTAWFPLQIPDALMFSDVSGRSSSQTNWNVRFLTKLECTSVSFNMALWYTNTGSRKKEATYRDTEKRDPSQNRLVLSYPWPLAMWKNAINLIMLHFGDALLQPCPKCWRDGKSKVMSW